jgi:hypothetical protein
MKSHNRIIFFIQQNNQYNEYFIQSTVNSMTIDGLSIFCDLFECGIHHKRNSKLDNFTFREQLHYLIEFELFQYP